MGDQARFGEILVRAGVLSRETLQALLPTLDGRFDLAELLIAQGRVDEQSLLQKVATLLNLPSVRLSQVQPDAQYLQMLSADDCLQHLMLPLHTEQGPSGTHLCVAMANPTDIQALKLLTTKTRLRVRPLLALGREIREAVTLHYGLSAAHSRPPSTPQQASHPPHMSFAAAPSAHSDRPLSAPPAGTSAGPLPISQHPPAVFPPNSGAPAPELVLGPPPMGPFDAPMVPTSSAPPQLPPAVAAQLDSMAQAMASRPLSPYAGPLQSNAPALAPPPPINLLDTYTPTPSLQPPPLAAPPLAPVAAPAPEPPPNSIAVPEGMVTGTRLDLATLLESMLTREEPTERQGDQIIAQALSRYGASPQIPGSAVFAALDHALLHAHSMSGRLTVVLIRQLARSGLVDADQVLADLKELKP